MVRVYLPNFLLYGRGVPTEFPSCMVGVYLTSFPLYEEEEEKILFPQAKQVKCTPIR